MQSHSTVSPDRQTQEVSYFPFPKIHNYSPIQIRIPTQPSNNVIHMKFLRNVLKKTSDIVNTVHNSFVKTPMKSTMKRKRNFGL